MANLKKIKRQWLIYAVSGLTLIGLGLSVMGEALIVKYESESLGEWFWIGTLALVIVNAGIALFGKAVVLRVKLDQASD